MKDLTRIETTSSKAEALEEAIDLMETFADRTGLTSTKPTRRYLWTDAFAVCNFLALAQATGSDRYSDLALDLVHTVHHVLGRHRDDDTRSGWLSGLSEQEGVDHPTVGGLRIGKPLRERAPEEDLDEALEWERDGQYFHYLTKWMHALDQVARYTGEGRFNQWARELDEVAHGTFFQPSSRRGGVPGLVWKMSTDLTRPLIFGQGKRDPLDGLITTLQLRFTASGPPTQPTLSDQMVSFASMVPLDALKPSSDPLDLGELLTSACRLSQISPRGHEQRTLLAALLEAALEGLRSPNVSAMLSGPAAVRLPFRELGLAIGLEAARRIRQEATEHEAEQPWREALEELERYFPLGDSIIAFWWERAPRRSHHWAEHRDINDVMLATGLVPGGYLRLAQSCAD